MLEIVGFPVVKVPVLSSKAISTSAADSRTSPPLAISPNEEAVVKAAACGTGDAKRREQGHETTQSNSVVRIACSGDPG